MTAQEAKYEFLLYFENNNFSAGGYEGNEISSFLSKAQERYIKTHYNPKGNKYREGFEASEKRRRDLAELLKSAEIDGTTGASASQTGVNENGKFFDLPSDFMWTANEEVLVSYTNCLNATTTQRASVKPVTHDEYLANKNNPFKKPYAKDGEGLVWRMDFSSDTQKRCELITDGTFTISKYYLRYFKQLPDVDIDNNIGFVLDSNIHREIIDLAIQIALENAQEQRWQTNKLENVNVE